MSLIQRFWATIFRNYDKVAKLNTIIVNGVWSFPPYFPGVVAEDFMVNIVSKTGQDEVLWAHGRFSLKNAWSVCRARGQIVRWKGICWKFCRPRISISVVIVVHNRNLSCVNLQRRGFAGPAIYHNCFNEEDTNDHLFCTCPYAVQVWQLVLSRLNLVQFQGLELLLDWLLKMTHCRQTKLLKGVVCMFIWKIWMERNNVLHGGIKESASVVANSIVWEVLNLFSLGIADVLDSPDGVG
ncbi:uncharacterized protein LOC132296398 [Cornus florida]|uniref:uncharacterized protein LOC132296398 n=1 Tax=Cornus florida TaxID=4283 RepID=UPI0028A0B94F|nr:uncharacterized protein LOC132296398 [Cornus florida]